MSAVVYTSMFHRPTHSNLKVFAKFVSFLSNCKPIHFQNKTKLDPSYHRLNTLKHLN